MLYIKHTHIPQCNIWGLVHADCSVMHACMSYSHRTMTRKPTTMQKHSSYRGSINTAMCKVRSGERTVAHIII